MPWQKDATGAVKQKLDLERKNGRPNVMVSTASITPCMGPTPANPSSPEPLVDLTRVPNPVLKVIMPVLGPLVNRAFAIPAINKVHDTVATTATSETFFRRTLEVLGCRYEVSESDLQRIPATGPVVVVCNHPLGGLDGIILGDLLRRRRTDVKLMANFLLKKIRFAEDHMIFVDPFAADKPAAHNIAPLRESLKHLKNGGLLAVFPGNKVSHYQWRRGEIADAEWVPHIASIIRRSGASVVPVFIDGGNSTLFNIAGMIHPLLRTVLLPREFIRTGRSGKALPVHVGTAIPAARLKKFETDEDMIRFLRVTTYFLGNRPQASASSFSIAGADRSRQAEPVADALSPDLLEQDIRALPESCCLMKQGDSEVYMARYEQLPHLIQEIGRGREISFRAAGGGTLKPLDLAPQDEYYEHLFIWNKKDRAIVGAYRIGRTDEIIAKHGPQGLICTGLFHFKPEFVDRLNPGLELGRSYVLPEYQKSYSSLLLLWGGIIAFIAREPRYNMTFGSVGVSQGDEYTAASRTLIIDLLRSQFSDAKLSVQVQSQSPFEGVRLNGITPDEMSDLVQDVEDVTTLVTSLEPDGKGVPVLIKHYIRMNAKLLDFGVWKNHSDAVVGFVVADVTTADPKMIRRYMGDEGYARFRAYHGLASGE